MTHPGCAEGICLSASSSTPKDGGRELGKALDSRLRGNDRVDEAAVRFGRIMDSKDRSGLVVAQSMLKSYYGCLGTIGHAELGHDGTDMVPHRAL